MAQLLQATRSQPSLGVEDVLLVIYGRRSFHGQKDGYGMERQLAATNPQAYADQRGWLLYPHPYIDDGKSGFTGANWCGELGRFLRDYHGGVFGSAKIAFGIEDINRFSRLHAVDALNAFVEDFLKTGITISLLNRNKDFTYESYRNCDMDHLELFFLMKNAHEESMRKRYYQSKNTERWRNTIAKAVDEGDHPKIRYGRAPGWISKTKEGFVLNEHATVLKEALELVKEHGLRTVAKKLNEKGYPTMASHAKDAKWKDTTIADIIRNPAVYGALRMAEPGYNSRLQEWRVACIEKRRKGVPESELPPKPKRTYLPVVDDYYPALISRDEYDFLNHTIAKRRISDAGAKHKCLFIGMGLSYCICGERITTSSPFRRSRKDGKVNSYQYLKCSSSAKYTKKDRKCTCPPVQLSSAQAHLLGRLRRENIALLFQTQQGRDKQRELEAAIEKRDGLYEKIEATKSRYTKNQEALLLIDEEDVEFSIRLERQKGLKQLLDDTERAYREMSATIRELSFADRPENHGEELTRLTREWFTAFAQGRDTVDMRKQINGILKKLKVKVVFDTNQRLMGISMDDSPIDWEPIDGELAITAIERGITGHRYYTTDDLDFEILEGERELNPIYDTCDMDPLAA